MAFPDIGSTAPDFSLQDQNGEAVTLTQFKGKTVVLYFYPKAMTPGCTVQACGIRDSSEIYVSKNIVTLAVSPDPHARLKKFDEKYDLNFTLLSDEDHAVAKSYGAWGLKKFMGKEYDGIHRITFIINEEGVIDEVISKVKTKDHAAQIL